MDSYSTYAELFETEITRVLNVCAPSIGAKRKGTHDLDSLSDEAITAKHTCRTIHCSLDKQITRSWSVSKTFQDGTDTSVNYKTDLDKVNLAHYWPTA